MHYLYVFHARNNGLDVVHRAAAQRAPGSATGTPVSLSKAVSTLPHRPQMSFSDGWADASNWFIGTEVCVSVWICTENSR